MIQTRVEPRAAETDSPVRAQSGATMMRTLAQTYPELGAFTPDATLTEIKTRYGLNSFEDVRELGRRRSGLRSTSLGSRPARTQRSTASPRGW
jgi:hypothetical protein